MRAVTTLLAVVSQRRQGYHYNENINRNEAQQSADEAQEVITQRRLK